MVFENLRVFPPQYSMFTGVPHQNLGWKIHSEATPKWFEGRFLTPQDAFRPTYDDTGAEELLRSGPPKSVPPYPYNNLIQYWGTQVLNAAGFINNPTTMQTGSGPSGAIAQAHQDNPIHPVLRRDMWEIPDDQWGFILPSLHLVTAILDTPETLRFFATMWTSYNIGYDDVSSRYIKRFHQFPPALDADQLEFIYRRLCDMRKSTTFRFRSQALIDQVIEMPGALGMTIRRSGADGFIPNSTFASDIYLSDQYISGLGAFREENMAYAEAYLNHHQQQGIHPDRRIYIDATSCKLRLQVIVATVIIHELAHAVNVATDQRPEQDRSLKDGEPFLPDDHVAELGYACEKFVFGGGLREGLGAHTLATMEQQSPFGACFFPDPTIYLGLHGRPRNDIANVTGPVYPVHMGWISAMFDVEFWEQQVQRYGGHVLRYPGPDGWAVLQ